MEAPYTWKWLLVKKNCYFDWQDDKNLAGIWQFHWTHCELWIDPSLPHFYIVFILYWNCSGPEYSWNTACWTLINNLSNLGSKFIFFILLHIWSQPLLLKRAWVNDMIKILFTVLLFNITYIGFEEWFDKNHWTKWNPFGICYLIFLSPDFFATVFSSELWTRSDSVIILFIKWTGNNTKCKIYVHTIIV